MSSLRTWWPVLLAAFLFAALTLRGIHATLEGNDFEAYHRAARAVVDGDALYGGTTEHGFQYLYPPTLVGLGRNAPGSGSVTEAATRAQSTTHTTSPTHLPE